MMEILLVGFAVCVVVTVVFFVSIRSRQDREAQQPSRSGRCGRMPRGEKMTSIASARPFLFGASCFLQSVF